MVAFIFLEIVLLLTAIFRLSEISFLKKNKKLISTFWNFPLFIFSLILLFAYLFSENTNNSFYIFLVRVILLVMLIIQFFLEVVFHIKFKPFRTMISLRRKIGR
jgi:hypothetical protein